MLLMLLILNWIVSNTRNGGVVARTHSISGDQQLQEITVIIVLWILDAWWSWFLPFILPPNFQIVTILSVNQSIRIEKPNRHCCSNGEETSVVCVYVWNPHSLSLELNEEEERKRQVKIENKNWHFRSTRILTFSSLLSKDFFLFLVWFAWEASTPMTVPEPSSPNAIMVRWASSSYLLSSSLCWCSTCWC
jgi:hypothetical protein